MVDIKGYEGKNKTAGGYHWRYADAKESEDTE